MAIMTLNDRMLIRDAKGLTEEDITVYAQIPSSYNITGDCRKNYPVRDFNPHQEDSYSHVDLKVKENTYFVAPLEIIQKVYKQKNKK